MRVWLFRLARTRRAGYLVGWMFAHMSFVIPVDRLHETATLLAFYHPKPSYPVHILIVPKRTRRGLEALSPADADFMVDLFAAVQKLVQDLGLERTGYRLICNGGVYKDVQQLHFHLISE